MHGTFTGRMKSDEHTALSSSKTNLKAKLEFTGALEEESELYPESSIEC